MIFCLALSYFFNIFSLSLVREYKKLVIQFVNMKFILFILLNTENYVLNRLRLLRIKKLPGNHENFPTYIRPVQN